MRTTRALAGVAAGVGGLGSLSLNAQQNGPPFITFQQLRDGLKEPSSWLVYVGDDGSQRHSPLTQITPANVSRLVPQWAFQTETLGKFETTPIVVDGVIYISGPEDIGWA